MSPTLRFFVILGVVSLIFTIAVNVTLGPPGFSHEYLEANKVEHDHYLEVIKSKPYKLYQQRPELHGPGSEGAPEDLAANIAFIEEYTATEAFQREQARRNIYNLVSDLFNTAVVVLIAVWFGRKPLLNFLDDGVEKLRAKVREAEDARIAAEARKKEAENKMAGLPNESRRVAQETRERLERELAELAEANQRSLELMEADLADRRQEVAKEAAMKLKKELVDAMIEEIEAEYHKRNESGGEANEAHQAALVDTVAGELEKRA